MAQRPPGNRLLIYVITGHHSNNYTSYRDVHKTYLVLCCHTEAFCLARRSLGVDGPFFLKLQLYATIGSYIICGYDGVHCPDAGK